MVNMHKRLNKLMLICLITACATNSYAKHGHRGWSRRKKALIGFFAGSAIGAGIGGIIAAGSTSVSTGAAVGGGAAAGAAAGTIAGVAHGHHDDRHHDYYDHDNKNYEQLKQDKQ